MKATLQHKTISRQWQLASLCLISVAGSEFSINTPAKNDRMYRGNEDSKGLYKMQ